MQWLIKQSAGGSRKVGSARKEGKGFKRVCEERERLDKDVTDGFKKKFKVGKERMKVRQ